jgi:hypothetical protein
VSEGRAAALQEIAALAARHGLDDEEVLAALRQAPAQPPAVRSSSVLARVLAYLGGALVLAGIALFINMQWDGFTAAARVLMTLGTGFALYLFALATLSDPRFEGVTTPLLLVAALLQPTGILVLLDEYASGGEPEHGLLFMTGVMFLQQLLTFLARRRSVLLFASLVFGAAAFGTACDILGVDQELIMLALGIGLMAITHAIDRTEHRAVTPFWYFAGSVFLLSGAFQLLEDTPVEICFFGVAAALMYLATVVRSRTLLLVSVVAMLCFAGYFFRDSLASALGLVLMGMLLIGLSAFAMSLNRKYIRRGQG